jgi:hypothetical protein
LTLQHSEKLLNSILAQFAWLHTLIRHPLAQVGHHPDVVLDRSKGVAEPGELGADSIRVQCQRAEDPHSANAIHRFFLFGAPCSG